MANSEVIKHFKKDNIIADFLTSYGTEADDRTSLFIRQRKNLIIEQVQKYYKDARILEVGCGIGDLSIELAELGYDCVAIDISDEAIEMARQKIPEKLKGSVSFSVGDLNELPIEKPYDVLIANGVIPYFEDKKEFLDCISKQLNSNGRSFITHRNSLFNLFALNRGTLEFIQEHLSFIDKDISTELSKEITGIDKERNSFSNSHLYRSEEVPFEMEALYKASNMDLSIIHSCCIHTQPPRIDDSSAEDYIIAQQKYQSDWRGLLLGSQFLAIAQKNVSI